MFQFGRCEENNYAGLVIFSSAYFKIKLSGKLYNEYRNSSFKPKEEIFATHTVLMLFNKDATDILDCEVQILQPPIIELHINGKVSFDNNCQYNSLTQIIHCDSFIVPRRFKCHEFIDTKTYLIGHIVAEGMLAANEQFDKITNIRCNPMGQCEHEMFIDEKFLALFPNIYGLEIEYGETYNEIPAAVKSKLLYIFTWYKKITFINSTHPFYNNEHPLNNFLRPVRNKPDKAGNLWLRSWYRRQSIHENNLHPKCFGYHANMTTTPLLKNAYN